MLRMTLRGSGEQHLEKLNVVVTGGAGFIGSHIVDAYIALGHRVLVIDDLSSGSRANLHRDAELIEGDIRDEGVLARLASLKIDLLSHHAAQADVRRSVTDPAFDADVNIVGSLRVIQAAVKAGARRVVFASSGGAIYGEPEAFPQREDHARVPVSPYGCAKLAMEIYLNYFRIVHGLASVSLRYANVYGPRQNSRGEAGVVAIFAERLLKGEPLIVNGSGEQTRDFVHVSDVVRANVAALRTEVEGSFNVGTGVETSLNEVVDAFRAVSPREVRVEHAEARKGEQLRSVLDGTALRRLAQLPEPLGFSDGLEQTFRWFEERFS
jgi:UDP-glucose 4-epimerase